MKIFVNHDDETAYLAAFGQTSGGNSKIKKIWLDYDSLNELGLEYETDMKNREFAIVKDDSFELEPVTAVIVKPAIKAVDGTIIVPEIRKDSGKKIYKLILKD